MGERPGGGEEASVEELSGGGVEGGVEGRAVCLHMLPRQINSTEIDCGGVVSSFTSTLLLSFPLPAPSLLSAMVLELGQVRCGGYERELWKRCFKPWWGCRVFTEQNASRVWLKKVAEHGMPDSVLVRAWVVTL
jgi:hypothetical protein